MFAAQSVVISTDVDPDTNVIYGTTKPGDNTKLVEKFNVASFAILLKDGTFLKKVATRVCVVCEFRPIKENALYPTPIPARHKSTMGACRKYGYFGCR